MKKVAKLNKFFVIPLMASVLPLAVFAFVQTARALQNPNLQKRKIVAQGYLAASRERFQIVTWQTANPPSGDRPYAKAHLAIETVGRNSRTVWQTDGGDSQYLVDAVQIVDLNKDSVPEILSLWWVGASAGAELRVFHWDAGNKSFAEIEAELGGIYRYRITAPKANPHILVYTRSERSASSPVASDEYELRNLKLALVEKKGSKTPVNDQTQSESGIEGEALIGPIRPVIRVNIPTPNTAPYQTTLVVVTAKEGREIRRFETGSDGKFRVKLPPGEYIIKPVTQGKIGGRASEEQVVVSAGKFIHVRINFDSGMR
jgi:hypothetical protein